MTDALTAIVVRAQNDLFQLRERESGQGLVEYALIIALVSLAAVAALGFLSGRINNLFSKAGNKLNTINP